LFDQNMKLLSASVLLSPALPAFCCTSSLVQRGKYLPNRDTHSDLRCLVSLHELLQLLCVSVSGSRAGYVHRAQLI
jgi:hypothetical protein